MGHRHTHSQALVSHDDGSARFLFEFHLNLMRFELKSGFTQFTAKNSYIPRSVDCQRYTVAGDPTNLNGDVAADVDLFANFTAEY